MNVHEARQLREQWKGNFHNGINKAMSEIHEKIRESAKKGGSQVIVSEQDITCHIGYEDIITRMLKSEGFDVIHKMCEWKIRW